MEKVKCCLLIILNVLIVCLLVSCKNSGIITDDNVKTTDESTTEISEQTQSVSIQTTTNTNVSVNTVFDRKTNYICGDAEYGFCEELNDNDTVEGAYFTIEGGQATSFIVSGIVSTIKTDSYEYLIHENGFAEIKNCLINGGNIEIPTVIDGHPIAYIGKSAFSSISMDNLIIPEGIIAIGQEAFANISSLKSVRLPNSLVALSSYAFSKCKNLKDVYMNENVEAIGSSCFEGCIGLKEVYVPKSVKLIASGAFADCTNLEKVVFNKGLRGISSGAFTNTSISELQLPDGISVIGPVAFSYCKNLKKAILPEKLGDAYNGFGAGMFGGCTSLEEVRIPNNVKGILQGTFQNCVSLKSITIPKSVEFMSFGVFAGCKNLKDIYFESKDCDILANNFMFMPGLRIHAPKGGSVEKYIRFNPLIKFVATD